MSNYFQSKQLFQFLSFLKVSLHAKIHNDSNVLSADINGKRIPYFDYRREIKEKESISKPSPK